MEPLVITISIHTKPDGNKHFEFSAAWVAPNGDSMECTDAALLSAALQVASQIMLQQASFARSTKVIPVGMRLVPTPPDGGSRH